MGEIECVAKDTAILFIQQFMKSLSEAIEIMRLALMKEEVFTIMADTTRKAYCNNEKCKKVTLQTKIVRNSDGVKFWRCTNCGRKVYA